MIAPTIRTLCVLLLGLSSTLASPLLNARQQPLVIFGTQAYFNGPYLFLGCSAEQGQGLVDLFQKIGTVLSNIIIPAVQTPSQDPNQDPFVTFFSSNSRNTVHNVFNAMNAGATVNGGGATIKRPNFICVNDVSGPYLGQARQLCASNPRSSAFTTGPLGGSTDIFLCPRFFTAYQQFPDVNVNCPVVNFAFNSAIFSDHKDVTTNQFSNIIHELAHIYSPHPIAQEIYDINEILYQTLDFQLNNAKNYDAYAAMVYMGCRTYPYLQNRPSTLGKLRAREELPAMSEPINYRLEGRQKTSTSTNTSIVPLDDIQQYTTDDVPLSDLGDFDFDGLAATLAAAGYPPGYPNP